MTDDLMRLQDIIQENRFSTIQRQVKSLPTDEKEQFIDLLRQLVEIDNSLADLHLCLPVVELRFYLLDARQAPSAAFSARELKEWLTGDNGVPN